MDRDDDPGANTEMFRIYVDGGEASANGRPAARIIMLVGVVAVVALVLGVLLLF